MQTHTVKLFGPFFTEMFSIFILASLFKEWEDCIHPKTENPEDTSDSKAAQYDTQVYYSLWLSSIKVIVVTVSKIW